MLTLIEDLGMQYQTETSKHKRRMGLYLCSGCGKTHKTQIAQVKAGYTDWCKECGHKSRRK